MVQEDDGLPAAAEIAEPYMPNGSQAGPLPHKETPFSPPSVPPSQVPPTANKGVSLPIKPALVIIISCALV